LLRGFRLVLEHREEPRRATRIAMSVRGRWPSLVAECSDILSALCPRNAPDRRRRAHSALFVHFFSGVLIQQHIRRKTTSRVLGSGVASGKPTSVSDFAGTDGKRVIRLHPACVDV